MLSSSCNETFEIVYCEKTGWLLKIETDRYTSNFFNNLVSIIAANPLLPKTFQVNNLKPVRLTETIIKMFVTPED